MLGSAAAHAATYNLTQLQSLSSTGNSLAYGLNENGTVVGQSYNSTTAQLEAVVWSGGTVTSIGVKGIARAVNNSGVVVGETGTATLLSDGRAFMWQAGTYTDIGTLGGSVAGAYDINETGLITGISTVPLLGTGSLHAFKYDSGTMSDLGTVSVYDGYARGHGINDAGEVVGRASLLLFFGSDKHMAHWEADGTLNSVTTSGTYSTAQQINNNGLIVGNGRVAGSNTQYGMIWDSGALTVLGDLGGNGSRLWSVNDAGVAVGWARDATNTKRAIITYDGGATIVDLNTQLNGLGLGDFSVLNEAYDINENGEIVGYGTLSDGSQGAFVMSIVPIPAAVWLFGSGLAGLGWLARRRRGA